MKQNKRKILTQQALQVFRLTMGSYPKLFIALVVFTILASIMPGVLAWAGRELIHAVTLASADDFSPVGYWILVGLGLSSLLAFFRLGSSYLNIRLNQEQQYLVDSMVLEHASRLELAHFENPALQDVIARAQHNMGHHVSKFASLILSTASAVLQAVSITVVLVAIDPVALIMVPFIFPHMIFQLYVGRMRYGKEYSRASKRRWTKYFTDVMLNRETIPEVRVFNLSPVLLRQFQQFSRRFIAEDRRIHRIDNLGNFLLEVVFQSVYYGIFAYAAWRVLLGELVLADLVVYIGATVQLRQALQAVSRSGGAIAEEGLYVSDLIDLLEVEPDEHNIKGASQAKLPKQRGEIELRDVSFRYGGTTANVLNNLSLRIEAGETVAIVGENGAGKSTLVKLIACLYRPQSGCVLFDGQDTAQFAFKDLHRQLAYIPQVLNRYEATVAQNIAYGDWERLDDQPDQIVDIARQAGIEEMIEAMPQQYDTMLGRKFGEYDLSGGQWQKLAIARAFGRNAPILIMDEPTANLDAEAEYELFMKMLQLARGRTAILVSHRFGTVRMADRILVMHEGRIVEQGSHDELIAMDGYYARLYNLQATLFHDPYDKA